MIIRLFEDPSSDLRPLSHCRPHHDLRCGMLTPLERTRALFPGAVIEAHVRDHLRDLSAVHHGLSAPAGPEADLHLNAAALIGPDTAAAVRTFCVQDAVFVTTGGDVVAVSTATPAFRDAAAAAMEAGTMGTLVDKADVVEMAAVVVHHAWDLIRYNTAMLESDARRHLPGCVASDATVARSAELEEPRRISIGPRAVISAGVVIDATDGPVIIGEDVRIMPQAVILGPACIGRGSVVKVGAKIYGSTSIGPVCKVGGEVEGSILHSYANKQHEGFLGHAYLAPWTNLGADTNTSDLKNTYSPVAMTIEGTQHQTGMQFLGLVMADHSKTGINTMLNTGTCIGVGCNVFGAGFPDKYLPSFTWGGSDGVEEYDFDRFLATARTVMGRRSIELDDIDAALLRHVYTITAHQREQFH